MCRVPAKMVAVASNIHSTLGGLYHLVIEVFNLGISNIPGLYDLIDGILDSMKRYS